MMNASPSPKSFLELYTLTDENPWGTGQEYRDLIRDHYSWWNSVGASALTPEELTKEVIGALGDTPAGVVGVFVKGTDGKAQDGGKLVCLHGFRRHVGRPKDPNRGKLYAYMGDVVDSRPNTVEVPMEIFQVAAETRILSTADLQTTYFADHPGETLAGPHVHNVTGSKKDIKTRNAMFIPFTLVEYVLKADLKPKDAFELIKIKVQEQGLQDVCKPLLEFLITASTEDATAGAPVTLHERMGAPLHNYEVIAGELQRKRLPLLLDTEGEQYDAMPVEVRNAHWKKYLDFLAHVNSTTDLTTLTGQGKRYKKLVETLFRSEFGNIQLGDILLTSKDEFLDEYAQSPQVKSLLRGWIEEYRLSVRFILADVKSQQADPPIDLGITEDHEKKKLVRPLLLDTETLSNKRLKIGVPIAKMPDIAESLPDHVNFDEKDPPEFLCSKEWLGSILNTIESLFDDSEIRQSYWLPPLQISRCSRGGKTRCLHEIASGVQKRAKFDCIPGRKEGIFSETIILMVSFNECISPIHEEEKKFPLFALTRRIYFALSGVEKTPESFDKFREYNITATQVSGWLKEKKCLLLIDGLNKLDLKSEHLEANNIELGRLLTQEFLIKKGRYFVFSTHEITTGMDLSNYMEKRSDCVEVAALPLIPNITDTVKKLGPRLEDRSMLTAPRAVYCGLVPGLFYTEAIVSTMIGSRLDQLLKTFVRRNPTDDDMIRILKSVLDGSLGRLWKFPELFELMDTTNAAKVRWIPAHLCCLLERVEEEWTQTQVSERMLHHLNTIRRLFDSFKDANYKSGDPWETLFAVMVLISALTRQGSDLLNLSHYITFYVPYQVFFNGPIEIGNKPFEEITTLSDLLECVDKVKVSQPTVGIYYRTHASFEPYDMIVRKWGENGVLLETIGYVLKEGSNGPSQTAPDVASGFDQSFVVRGQAAKASLNRNWHFASTDQLDTFFGVSGAEWTPAKWKELNQSENSTDERQGLDGDDSDTAKAISRACSSASVVDELGKVTEANQESKQT